MNCQLKDQDTSTGGLTLSHLHAVIDSTSSDDLDPNLADLVMQLSLNDDILEKILNWHPTWLDVLAANLCTHVDRDDVVETVALALANFTASSPVGKARLSLRGRVISLIVSFISAYSTLPDTKLLDFILMKFREGSLPPGTFSALCALLLEVTRLLVNDFEQPNYNQFVLSARQLIANYLQEIPLPDEHLTLLQQELDRIIDGSAK